MKEQPIHTLIDLSHPIIDRMPAYPGDEPARLEKISDFAQDGFNNFRITSGMHTGTHIDGPMHMTKSDCFIDDLPLERFIGTGCFLNAMGMKVIPCTPEFASAIVPESIVLIYTGFGKQFGSEKYYRDHPVISMELTQLLVQQRIKIVCFDTPSPDKYPHDIHTYLLKNSVLIAENLTRMEKLLTVKKFEIMALPLRIHADSSPARIVARILEETDEQQHTAERITGVP
jgi:kynurenine formamidase